MSQLNSRLNHPFLHVSVFYSPADSTVGGARKSARILVVEDDFIVALDMEYHLIAAGFEVVGVATTAEEALQMADAGDPHLAIMDIRLAGDRDGVDAATELRHRLGVPSIFASAHGDMQTRQRAARAKPLGWLQKPYSAEALVALVSAALAGGG